MKDRGFEDYKTDPALLARIGLDNKSKIPKAGHNPLSGLISEEERQQAIAALAEANRQINVIPAKF